MEGWAAILRNPTSGAGTGWHALTELLRALRSRGIEPRLFSNRERLRRRLADPKWRKRLVCVVAAGGDGTVNDVVNRHPGVPVAVLPLGTENLLARHLGIPASGAGVADLIAAGQRRRLDLGLLGTHRFTLMASAGFDGDVVHRTHAERTGHITRWGYARPILGSLLRYPFPPMRVYVDGSVRPLTARLVVAVNVPAYARGLRVADSARDDDGLLDLRLFERGSRIQMVRYAVRVGTATHDRLPDVRSVRASRVRIESDGPVPLQADGDPAGWTPAELTVQPGALEVFAPPVRPIGV